METNKEMNRTSFLDTRKAYEAPFMEIVEIKVELGFQMSGASEAAPYDPLKELIK